MAMSDSFGLTSVAFGLLGRDVVSLTCDRPCLGHHGGLPLWRM
jgi:hypothetical protein